MMGGVTVERLMVPVHVRAHHLTLGTTRFVCLTCAWMVLADGQACISHFTGPLLS